MREKYTINLKDLSQLEENINIFLQEVTKLDCIGYVLPHFFNDHNEITSYWALIIQKKWEIEELEYIKETYNIEPNFIYSDWNTKHLVFILDRWVSKIDYKRMWSALSFIYDWEQIDYHFFPEYKIYKDHINKEINSNLFSFLNHFSFRIKNNTKYERVFSTQNLENLEKANKLSIVDILTLLRLPLIDIDIKKNIHLKYGYPFDFVNSYLANQKKAFEFFNKNFWLDFELSWKKKEILTRDWILIEWKSFLKDEIWYYKIDEKSWIKRITDFVIKVYYKIIQLDWTHNFIISLINESIGTETDKIVWCNDTWITAFSNFIQKYWNFHYYWTAWMIKDLHREVSETKNIPIIKNIVWYWFQKEDNIIVFKNWIWDLKEKIFTEKKEDDKYYFNYNYQWYYLVDNAWKDLSLTLSDWVPSLNTTKIVNYEEIIEFLNTLYNDDSWRLLLYYTFWMIWYLLYWEQKDSFPFFFTRWLTWSWKTSYNNLFQRIWWINKWWSTFSSTTFSIQVMLTYLNKFPFFLWEYRENVQQADQKKEMLRNVFDRTAQVKWRADQSTVSYNYYAIPIMDWEEMINDWAVRTRTIQKQFLKSHRIWWNFWDILRKKWEILDNILFTYLLKSSKEKYEEWLKEWIEIFTELNSKSDPRIWDNYSKIYAWCRAITDSQDVFDVLLNSMEFQQNDVKENWTSMQIIKAINQFLDSYSFSCVERIKINDDITKDKLVIYWNLLDEYVKKYKVQLSLNYDTYKEHIKALWYEVDYIDNWNKLIYWVIVPIDNIPKQFLIHPEFYLANKEYQCLKNEIKF